MNSRNQHRSGSRSPADGDYSCRSRRSKQRRIGGGRKGSGWIETNPIPNVTILLRLLYHVWFRTGNLELLTPVIKVAAGRPLAAASQYSRAITKTSSILFPLHALSLQLLGSDTPDATGLGLYLRHSGPVTLVLGFLLLFALELLVFTGTGLATVTSPPSLDTASPQAVKLG